MKELERLRAQNKILREILDAFIEASEPRSEDIAFTVKRTAHIRMKAIALLKRIDDFSTKRLDT